MALVDIDRHILLELTVLSEKMRGAAVEFKLLWEIIGNVREKVALIVLGYKDAENPDLPKLKDEITRAMNECNTRMIFMDDCMSRQAALLNHLVTEVKEADTGKGTENGRSYTTVDRDS